MAGLLLLCGFLVMLVYGQVSGHAFLSWDDKPFYIEKPILHEWSLASLKWVLTSYGDGIWMPATWLSFMLEFRWLGDAPGPHLLINPVIHALNAALVGWLVFSVLSFPALVPVLPSPGRRWGAGLLAAGLFAVHPLQVEAAAWLSGRKEVLCAFFYLLSVASWVQCLQQPGKHRQWATLAWVAQALGILSHPMAVTVPVIMVLLDGVARRPEPFWRLVLGKWPFWLLSAFIVPVAIWGEMSAGTLPDMAQVGLFTRYEHGVSTYLTYLAKMLIPLNLVPYYPSQITPRWSWAIMGSLVIALMLWLAWHDYRRGQRVWCLLILWYLAVFMPVAGWLQVGGHCMADRYAYLPVVPWYAAVAVLLLKVLRSRVMAGIAALALLLVLGFLCQRQVAVWKNDRTLWEFTATRQPTAGLVLNNLAYARAGDGDMAGAIQAYRQALSLDAVPLLFQNLISAYAQIRDWQGMLEVSRKAMEHEPGDTGFQYSAAQALLMLGRYDESLALFSGVLEKTPEDAPALWGKAYVLAKLGRREESLQFVQQLLRVNPDYPSARDLEIYLQEHR